MLWVRLLAKRAVRRKSYAGGLQMNPRSKCIAAVVLLFAFLLVAQAPPVCAQTAATGQIVGTVTDQLASASDGKPAASKGVDGSKDTPPAKDRERIASRRFILLPSMKRVAERPIAYGIPRLRCFPTLNLHRARVRRNHGRHVQTALSNARRAPRLSSAPRGNERQIRQGRKSRSSAENKAVTDRTFMKFRGPQALTDTSVNQDSKSENDNCLRLPGARNVSRDR